MKWFAPLLTAALLSGAGGESGSILNRKGLAPFFEKLMHGGPVHILQFGDSQTASDDWVNAMRQQFQSVHGNGGPGWVTAGHIRYYRRWDAHGENSAGWTVEGAVGHLGDGRMGLGGFSLTTKRAGEWISIETDTAKLALFYLRSPGAGSFDVNVDNQPLVSVDANGESGLGRYDVPVVQGMHRYTLRTTTADMPVRVFGWAADNESGITWETLGINGAQAEMILDWDRALWTAQLKDRDPALVILAYGTNEALSRKWTGASYRETLSRLIALIHQTVPAAGILLVGPPDCGRVRPFPHLSEVIAIQKAVATEMGAAFWDWRKFMGGPGSDPRWVRRGLMQRDYTHLTEQGYKLLGDTLAAQLEREAGQWAQKSGL